MNINELKNLFVEPCTSTRTGEAVKNQYVITNRNWTAFQSYSSLVAIYDRENKTLLLGGDFDYSRTTAKYLGQFIRDYCGNLWQQLPNGKSLSDSLRKAIKSGLISYDATMR